MPRRPHPAGGFTLLEVMVAMVILALAVVAALQLSSQSLRLLKLSGEHQEAAFLADQLLRSTTPGADLAETGQEGPFTWERRVAVIPPAKELAPATGPEPQLLSISVSVRWSGNRSLEMATLRTTPPPAEAAAGP